MKNEIKQGAILGYINTIATIIVSFLYTPIMLRLMGQSEYGLYSLVSSVIAYLSVLDMGFGNAMVRYVSKSLARREKEKETSINGLFFFLYCIIGLVALVVGAILYFNINNLFASTLTSAELEKAKIIMLILIGTVAINFPLSVFDSYAVAHEKFSFLKIMAILKTISVPLTMLPFLYGGFKSITMVIVTSSYNILFHIITMIYCRKKLNMKLQFKLNNFDKLLFKEIAFYSFWIFLNIIVDNIYKNTDQIILGSVCGTISVSIYAIAAQISQMNQTFSTTISGLFLPRVSKILEEDNSSQKLSDLFIKISRIQIYIMTLILSGFVIFGQPFINNWAGEDYNSAYYIALLLLIPSLIPLTQNVGISIIQAKNKHQFRSIVYIIIAVLNIFLSIPLARKYAGIGAAVGTAIANLLGQILTMNIFYWKSIHIDIPKYWKFLISFLIPIIILSGIGLHIVNTINMNLFMVLIGASIYTIIYLIIVYLYMNDDERGSVNKIVAKLKKK